MDGWMDDSLMDECCNAGQLDGLTKELLIDEWMDRLVNSWMNRPKTG